MGGLKGKAIIALTRKLTKALWHVARGERFDSAKLFHCESPAMAT
jgi:transposase